MNDWIGSTASRVCTALVLTVTVGICANASFANDEFSDALKAVQSIQPNGIGNEAAVRAMKVLNRASPKQIPEILAAMDDANPIALNWLRSAVNQAAARDPGAIPKEQLQTFFEDQSHGPMARLMAFELLTAGDPAQTRKMTAGLLDDPSLPLRYKAVAQLMEDAKAVQETDPVAAVGKLGVALGKARNVAQVQAIAQSLEKMGVQIDLRKQMGMLIDWKLVASFDNKDMGGFDVAYGPESNLADIDAAATYEDMKGGAVSWQSITSGDALGTVDLNKAIGKVKGATAYAMATFRSDESREAQFRLGTPNATKVWLNGELVMSNEIYHNSNSLDKFIGDVKLKKGTNVILIKVCQNEQTQPWAQDWQFQFRVCDKLGTAIPEFSPPASRF